MRIIHPRPEDGLQHFIGVDFNNGVAEVESLHPEREKALLQHGFTIEPDEDVEAPYHGGLGEPIVDLTKLTKAELLDIADTEGVDVPAKATKAQLVEVISAQPAARIPADIDNGDGTFTHPGYPELASGAGMVGYADGSPVEIGEDGIPILEDRTNVPAPDEAAPEGTEL